jgi:hypothetical protein
MQYSVVQNNSIYLTPSLIPSCPVLPILYSAASLSLCLADDSQERSLYTGLRPLAYNALIVGRDRNRRSGSETGSDGRENGVKEIGKEIGGDISRGDILGGERTGGLISLSSSLLAVKKGIQPLCRIYKVDLTGNFYRCQAGATGIMWEKAEV